MPGLKVIKTHNQISTLPKTFHVDFPDQLVDEIVENPKHTEEIGIRWAMKQCQELLEKGAPGLHFYVMNDAHQIVNIYKKLRG